MKLPLNVFIESVEDELLCYDNMETAAKNWKKEFLEWIEKNKGIDKAIIEEKGVIYFKIKDEDEIFETADSYVEAAEENSVKEYWDKF